MRQIARPRVVVIGGSAGALDALFRMMPRLDARLPFPIIVVLHRKSAEEDGLADLLTMKTRLAVRDVEDKDAMRAGTVHLAPGDYHLLFEKDGTLSLDFSEKVAYSRPSINVAFASAVEAMGKGVVAVLLSGANNDGVDGLRAVQSTGGYAIAQDPVDAEMPVMPRAAVEAGAVDAVMRAEAIADWLNGL